MLSSAAGPVAGLTKKSINKTSEAKKKPHHDQVMLQMKNVYLCMVAIVGHFRLTAFWTQFFAADLVLALTSSCCSLSTFVEVGSMLMLAC